MFKGFFIFYNIKKYQLNVNKRCLIRAHLANKIRCARIESKALLNKVL